jgi:hypothetical protein
MGITLTNVKPEELKPGYERVFTVTDFYDGPRKGIANYRGAPHFYDCIFDEAKDEYSELFQLTTIDAETFQLAMEDWNIWRRWAFAFHAGETDASTHPALPQDANRHAELKRTLDRALVTDPLKAFTKVGRFEVIGEPSVPNVTLRPLQVTWA